MNQYLLLDNAYGIKPVMTYDADGNLSELIDLIKADMNCDGQITFSDIDAFVLALQGEAAYYAVYPNCNWLNGDCNGDGTVNFADVDAFNALLGGGNNAEFAQHFTWDAENRVTGRPKTSRV